MQADGRRSGVNPPTDGLSQPIAALPLSTHGRQMPERDAVLGAERAASEVPNRVGGDGQIPLSFPAESFWLVQQGRVHPDRSARSSVSCIDTAWLVARRPDAGHLLARSLFREAFELVRQRGLELGGIGIPGDDRLDNEKRFPAHQGEGGGVDGLRQAHLPRARLEPRGSPEVSTSPATSATSKPSSPKAGRCSR